MTIRCPLCRSADTRIFWTVLGPATWQLRNCMQCLKTTHDMNRLTRMYWRLFHRYWTGRVYPDEPLPIWER